HDVVRELIQAANDAGGRDNVTVVYVEGEEFAAAGRGAGRNPRRRMERERSGGVEHGRFSRASAGTAELKQERTRAGGDRRRWRHIVRLGLVALLALLIGYAAYRVYGGNAKLPTRLRSLLAPPIAVAPSFGDPIVVTPSGSIAAVLEGAAAGTTVMVEPG